MGRAPLIWCLLVAVCVGAPRARAAQDGPRRASITPVILRVERSPAVAGCPDEPALRRAVEQRLGANPFVAEPAQAGRARRFSVTLRKRGRDRLAARIEVVDERGRPTGKREITTRLDDCRELGATVAFQLAVAIDPEHDFSLSPTPPSRTSDPTPPPTGPPDRERSNTIVDREDLPPDLTPPPPVQPRRTSPVHFRGSFALHGAIGSAPTAAFGLALALGVRARHWSLGVEARGDVPVGRRVDEGRVSTALITGSLVPCLHVSFFTGCLLGGLGPQWLRSSGYAVSPQAVALVAQLGPRLAVEFPLVRSLVLLLHADLLVALTQPHLVVTRDLGTRFEDREAFRLPRLSAVLGVGLVLDLGRARER